MACEAYVDGLADVAAGGSVSPEVQSHLETCEACRAELGAQQQALALVDSELGDRLASEPSPSLRARISLAVAAAGPARRTLAWPLAAAVAVSVVALALLAVTLRDGGAPAGGVLEDSDRNDRVVESRPPDDRAPSVEPNRSLEEEIAPKTKAPPRSIRRLTARARSAGSRLEPEVLVPPDEAAALFRFARELQNRQVAPGSLVAAEGPAPPLRESPPLHIAPLDIASLDASDASGT